MNRPDKEKIFSISNDNSFRDAALEIFRYQALNNRVYAGFIDGIGKKVLDINRVEDIPFMPVEFFKSQRIVTGDIFTQKIFESSGTTGVSTSKHYIADIKLYEKSFLESFRLFYGEPSDYIILALLPSYVERKNSSLVYMMADLIDKSGNLASGFFLGNTDELISTVHKWKNTTKKILLLGVSFALLDMAEKDSPDLSGITVMETGGMKGRRKEIIRSELHSILTHRFNVEVIHSEYGMTELLSQSYSKGEGRFESPPWMKILTRDPQDPLTLLKEPGRTGGINIIDLANINSCSFIATSDLGKVHADNSFEIVGRFDNSDIRGCNLLIE
jgi:phenylacetate-coenzyme A ligase PaaK-like adenylate-forming protein